MATGSGAAIGGVGRDLDAETEAFNRMVASAAKAVRPDGVMSDTDATAYWRKIYEALGLTTDETKVQFQIMFAMWVLTGSTSAARDTTASFQLAGRERKWLDILRLEVLPLDHLRRFWRAAGNVALAERIARTPAAASAMASVAARNGLRHPIVVCDFAEFMNLSAEERAELSRFGAARKSPNATLEAVGSSAELEARTAQAYVGNPAASTIGDGLPSSTRYTS